MEYKLQADGGKQKYSVLSVTVITTTHVETHKCTHILKSHAEMHIYFLK